MKKIHIDPDHIDHSLIKKAAQVILKGGVVALPTETVYGLAVRSDKEEVVEKLYQLKKRPRDKPFSFACGSTVRVVNDFLSIMPPFVYRLMEEFLPGPLTIIYYSHQDKKIGVRVPSHAVAKAILQELNVPAYLPSANISGEKEAVSAAEVEAVFGDSIDLIVESGRCEYSRPSTVVDFTHKPYKIVREGIVPEKNIARAFVKKRIILVCTGNSCRSPMAQFLLVKYLRQLMPYSENRYEIFSAGISAYEGSAAAPYVISILREREDLDVRDFHARKLDKYMVLSSDLIFTMEDAQSEYVLKFVPSSEGRVFNLKKFLPPELEKDIPDPIGRNMGVYQEAYDLIKKATLELIEWL